MDSERQHPLRLGTRASQLALVQAEQVASSLRAIGQSVEIVHLTTMGDQRTDVKLSALGGVGAFTKEIQHALLDDRIDLAVHSLKDLPTTPHEGLLLAATPRRTMRHDVAVCVRYASWTELPPDAIIGTGSLRRSTQLIHRTPTLRVRPIRGNIETRLRKLESGEYDAILLSAVSLYRLGLENDWPILPPPWEEWLCPAAGQGAIGIEIRSADRHLYKVLQKINDPATFIETTAERAMLRTLGLGCSAPVGASAELTNPPDGVSRLRLHGCVLSEDGRRRTDVRDEIPLPSEPLEVRHPSEEPATQWLSIAQTLG